VTVEFEQKGTAPAATNNNQKEGHNLLESGNLREGALRNIHGEKEPKKGGKNSSMRQEGKC